MSGKKERADLNAAIALHFGFRRGEEENAFDGFVQWTYPQDWYLAQGGVPNFHVPDFLQMLEDYLVLIEKHTCGGPREYFGRLDMPLQAQTK